LKLGPRAQDGAIAFDGQVVRPCGILSPLKSPRSAGTDATTPVFGIASTRKSSTNGILPHGPFGGADTRVRSVETRLGALSGRILKMATHDPVCLTFTGISRTGAAARDVAIEAASVAESSDGAEVNRILVRAGGAPR